MKRFESDHETEWLIKDQLNVGRIGFFRKTQNLNGVVRSPTPFKLGQNDCCLPEGLSYTRHSPYTKYVFAVLLLERLQKGSMQPL